MKDTVVIIGSITYTMKAQKALQGRGIDCYVIKRASDENGGCRYGIKCSAENTISAIAVLKELNIPYRSISSDVE